MERRNFLIAWITGILYAIFPSLRPKRYLIQLEPIKTYGGQDLRAMLRGNSEFRTLEMPYVIEEGVPIGLMPPIGFRLEPEPLCFELDGTIKTYEELTTGTTGGTRVTPAS